MAAAGQTGTFQLTVSTTPVTLPTRIPGTVSPAAMKPVSCDLIVVGAPVLFTDVGLDPATAGVEMPVGGVISLANYGEIKRFRAIRSGGVDAELHGRMGTDWHP